MKEALALVAMMLLGIFAALGGHIQAFSNELPASNERLTPVYTKIDTLKKNNNTDAITTIVTNVQEKKKNLVPTSHTYKSLSKIEHYLTKKRQPTFVTSSSSSLPESVVKALAEMF